MSQLSAEPRTDKRIRRTRRLLQSAMQTLIEQKSFDAISITDICKQADIARVTFYQHYESKEALLLACVSEIFGSANQLVNPDQLSHFLETGEIGGVLSAEPAHLAEPARGRLIRVALHHVGPAIRELTIQLFLEMYAEQETELNQKEVETIANFYVGGLLTLFEQQLNGKLSISFTEMQMCTLTLLRAVRQGAMQSPIFPGEN